MTNSIRPSTRDAILEAGFELFNRDPGASLAKVAELAGIGRATLHRHFAGRDDLLRALALIAVHEMDEVVEDACEDVASYSEALRVSLEVLIPLGDRYSFLGLDAIEHDPEIQDQLARQKRETESLVDKAKREGTFAKSLPTSWIVQVYEHLLFAAWESVKAGEATQAQASALAWQTLMSGVGKDS